MSVWASDGSDAMMRAAASRAPLKWRLIILV